MKNCSYFDSDILNSLRNYKDTINSGNPCIKLPEVHIDTIPNSRPVYSHPYRVSEHKQGVIVAQINDWFKSGIVRPSTSPWANPIVLVTRVRDDGTIKYRVCGNFIKLNRLVSRVNYLYPKLMISSIVFVVRNISLNWI